MGRALEELGRPHAFALVQGQETWVWETAREAVLEAAEGKKRWTVHLKCSREMPAALPAASCESGGTSIPQLVSIMGVSEVRDTYAVGIIGGIGQ